jgi:NADPH2:quinone reductase
MRALIVRAIGQEPVLEEVDGPRAGDGRTLVAMGAAGINPIDLAIAAGRFYGGSPEPPYGAGREGVGRVLDGGDWPAGTRIYTGRAATGSIAERYLVTGEAYELPDGDDDDLAVGLGIAGLAGWLPVEHRARLQPGERVLVLGATGTVGMVAVQAARLLGAGRIVAAGRSADRLERARRVGADATVQIRDGVDLAAAFRDAFDGEGPDVVIDPVWGTPAVAALQSAAMHARLVNLGQSAGAEAVVASGTVRGKSLDLLGHTNYHLPLEVRRETHVRMLELARVGELQLDLESYPLARADDAWRAQAAGPSHKIVVKT